MRTPALTLLFVFLLCTAAFAEEAAYRVTEVSGKCEIVEPFETKWKPLTVGTTPAKGSAVRATGKDSFVELSADPHLENMLRIGSDSRVAFLHTMPLRLSLDAGSLFILKEEQSYVNRDAELSAEVRILTKDFLVSVRQGGCELDTTGKRVLLRTFAESIQLYPKVETSYSSQPITIEEGFAYSAEGQTRLAYEDYTLWQAWYKRNNERKDDRHDNA